MLLSYLTQNSKRRRSKITIWKQSNYLWDRLSIVSWRSFESRKMSNKTNNINPFIFSFFFAGHDLFILNGNEMWFAYSLIFWITKIFCFFSGVFLD